MKCGIVQSGQNGKIKPPEFKKNYQRGGGEGGQKVCFVCDSYIVFSSSLLCFLSVAKIAIAGPGMWVRSASEVSVF